MQTPVLEVRRNDLSFRRVVEAELGPLSPGRVRLEVERVALTANTVTYGLTGDRGDYWDFYPSTSPDWGRVPAIGWGRVAASEVPGIEPGQRYYGWFPMAGHLDIAATPTDSGIRDDGPHRRNHAPLYRSLIDVRRDPLHPSSSTAELSTGELRDLEDRHAILRPLFTTGFLAERFLDVNKWFDADEVIVLSASSKTAIAFAACARAAGLRLTGVTSPRSLQWLDAMGWYDRILTYSDAATSVHGRAIVVDMAGNGDILAELYRSGGLEILHTMLIGRSHQEMQSRPLPDGPTPVFFSANQGYEALGEAGIDIATIQRDRAAQLHRFIKAAADWLDIERRCGAGEVDRAWSDALNNRVPPNTGLIVSMHADATA